MGIFEAELICLAQRRGVAYSALAYQHTSPENAQSRQRLQYIRDLKEVVAIAQRKQSIEQLGEVCLPVAEWVIEAT